MAEDIILPSGTPSAYKRDSGNANLRSLPVFGVVKDNADPTRSGRLRVYISDFSGIDPEDADSWVTVSYMSPFYGFIAPTAADSGYGSYVANPSSYGMWYSQPDIGSTVICIFVNGDMNYGFWIGCVPKAEALTMVPAVGGSENVIMNPDEAQSYGGAEILPVTNLNTNNDAIADSETFITQPKPVHSYTAEVMFNQGVIKDPVRGPITSTAQRESPSRVGWGVSTPGRPIYGGGEDDYNIADAVLADNTPPEKLKIISRRGGHSIVMDDGDLVGQNQLIRIRTALGHQILLSDDGQTLMLLHSNGKSYIELGKEGTIDMFSTNSVNIRSQGDINLHADNSINLNANKNLLTKANNIKVEAEKTFSQKTGMSFKQETKGVHTVKAMGTLVLESMGPMFLKSSSMMFLTALKLNLNSGGFSFPAGSVSAIRTRNLTDTVLDDMKGYIAAPGKLKSIVSRAPAHCPWANAGEGADLTSTDDSDMSFPISPSTALSALNSGALPSGISDVLKPSLSTVASIPGMGQVSQALNSNMTDSMMGTIAAQANQVTSGMGDFASFGAGIVDGVARVGAFAQSATEMALSGVLKPGTGALINNLVANMPGISGANLSRVFTPNMFSGLPGAENLQSFINNVPAQVVSQTGALQVAQTGLTAAGLITGKESGVSIAGPVLAAAKLGVGVIASAAFNGTSLPTSAKQLINAGNYAATMGENILGGMGPIVNASIAARQIDSMAFTPNAPVPVGLYNADRGAAAAAFATIASTFRPFQANTPVNLKREALLLASARIGADIASAGTDITGNRVNFTYLSSNATSWLGGSAVQSAQKASGLANIPGGQLALSVADLAGRPYVTALRASTFPPTLGYVNVLGQAAGAVAAGTARSLVDAMAGIPNTGLSPSQMSSISSSFQNLAAGVAGTAVSSLTNMALNGLPQSAKSVINALSGAMTAVGAMAGAISSFGVFTSPMVSVWKMKSLLGDPRIPVPNYNADQGQNEVKARQVEGLTLATESVVKNAVEARKNAETAKAEYYAALNDYPEDSRQVQIARDYWLKKEDLLKRQLEIIARLQSVS